MYKIMRKSYKVLVKNKTIFYYFIVSLIRKILIYTKNYLNFYMKEVSTMYPF